MLRNDNKHLFSCHESEALKAKHEAEHCQYIRTLSFGYCPFLTNSLQLSISSLDDAILLRCMHAYNVVTLSVRPSCRTPRQIEN